MIKRGVVVLALLSFHGVTRCAAQQELSFDTLPGWAQDDHTAAFRVFAQSCAARAAAKNKNEALSKICALTRSGPPDLNESAAKSFFETYFTPVRYNTQGLMTGYYEPEFIAARQSGSVYNVPMFRRPADLVAQAIPGRSEYTAARRDADGHLVPYYSREEIENGALDEQKLTIFYMKNSFDLFTLQVQGSGRLKLLDGTTARVAFDGKNGQPYTAIGKTLIDRGLLQKGKVNMQSIGAVLNADPALARDIMRSNKSYVFFKEIKGHDAKLGPFGAQGVPLTPYRSIAIDRSFHEFGAPIYIDGTLPGGKVLRTLAIAQDTGSAIKGEARIDFFTGWGGAAADLAGLMQQPVTLYALQPKG